MNLSQNEISTIAEITKLKLIEDRYATLKRYLRLHFKNHPLISKEEVEIIIKSLDDDPLEVDEKIVEENAGDE